jgi:hypothetical protein
MACTIGMAEWEWGILSYGTCRCFETQGVPGPTSELSPRAPTQMGRREAECNAPNFAVEFFLFFTRQNSGVTFPFSFSLR